MLTKESPCGYNILENVKDIDFNTCFVYRNDEMAVEYNSLEKVFHVSKRKSPSHSIDITGSLSLLTSEEEMKLLELIKKDTLLKISESGMINDYFEKSETYMLKRFIDSMNQESKDNLLLRLLLRESSIQ